MDAISAPSSERRRRRVLALAIGVVATFALAELAVRALDLPPSPLAPLYVPSYRLSDDALLGYEYRPSYRGEGGGFDEAHRALFTNAHGFRDRERTLEKPPGTLRMLALGDSTTAGVGVDDAELVYPQVLERNLRERDAGAPVEVLNMGVGGYHTAQEVRALELSGLAFDPDLVTLLFCVNDFYAAADGGVKERLVAARAHLEEGKVPEGSLLGALLQRSRLAFFVYHRIGGWVDSWGDAEFARDPRLVEDGLRRLHELSGERGLPVLVFILPALKDPWAEYRHTADHEELRAIAARVGGVEVIDLLPDFAALGPDPEPYRFDGLHLNAAGHAALAEMIERHLRERGFLGDGER